MDKMRLFIFIRLIKKLWGWKKKSPVRKGGNHEMIPFAFAIIEAKTKTLATDDLNNIKSRKWTFI